VEPLAPLEPVRSELVGLELRRDASIRDHRSISVPLDERDDDAVPARRRRSEDVDGPPQQVCLDELTRGVRPALANEASLGAERGSPGSNVRGLAARADSGQGPCVVAVGKRSRKLDDHVQEQVAECADGHAYHAPMDDQARAARLRSFLLGGLVGASAALSVARRRRRRRRRGPLGLAAFEDAPCYRETLEERERGV
jgi:hypothetical protein